MLDADSQACSKWPWAGCAEVCYQSLQQAHQYNDALQVHSRGAA